MEVTTKMATLKTGEAVEIALDFESIQRGTFVRYHHDAQGRPTVAIVETACSQRPCPFGYIHPHGPAQEMRHTFSIKAQNVNPVALPKPIRTYEQIFGSED